MPSDDDFDTAIVKALSDLGDANGIKHSIWSVTENPEDITTDKMNEITPYTNAKWVVYQSDPFYGEPSGEFKVPVQGNTWLDLWKAADDILGRCGDEHHRFIEYFTEDESGEILTMECGS